jgi:DNA ligase-1
MLLAEVAEVSRRVAETPGRLAKVRELADCLRRVTPDEVPLAIAFLSGETRQGRLGVGYAALRQAAASRPQAQPSLTLQDVDTAFAGIVAARGKGAAALRAERLAALFDSAMAEERDFLARLVAGELRQGALEGLMIEAVAAAAAIPVAEVRRATMLAGDIGEAAGAALAEGSAGLGRFAIRLMQPVLPMLSQTAQDTDEALQHLGTAALEWKLDGARVQVHKAGSDVRVYTRTLNDVTARVPEIVEAMRASPDGALILDGEAIAVKADGSPHPFQVTMRRFGRKLNVDAMRRELPLSVFFFDCLLRNDRALVDRPSEERFRELRESVPAELVIPQVVTADRAEAARFFEEALRRGHEGLMAKSLDAPYEAGRRGASWLKIKRANTLDLVVLAAEWGSGRRRGRLSNLHLGARDPGGGFVMLGKTFKGLTDELLEWQTKEFLRREVRRDDWTVYVKPELVVEVAFNEVQESSQYPGGVTLRFARLKRYRPDKRSADADTIDAVRAILAAQGGESKPGND